jgi:nitrite reductase/ring-hydroxylating ferredoxin subunit
VPVFAQQVLLYWPRCSGLLAAGWQTKLAERRFSPLSSSALFRFRCYWHGRRWCRLQPGLSAALQLIKFLALTSLGMFAGNVWILIRSWLRRDQTYPRQEIALTGDIQVGGVKLFRYPTPREQCLLVRTGENEYVAYSQKCTHLSCAVYYSQDDNQLICPCHNGRFSIRDGAQEAPTWNRGACFRIRRVRNHNSLCSERCGFGPLRRGRPFQPAIAS